MLFDKFAGRSLHLANHLVMASMPRSRATPRHTADVPETAIFYVPVARGYTGYPALAA